MRKTKKQRVVVEVIQRTHNNLLHVATLLGQKGFEFDPSQTLCRIGSAKNVGLEGTVEEGSHKELLKISGVVEIHDPSSFVNIIVRK